MPPCTRSTLARTDIDPVTNVKMGMGTDTGMGVDMYVDMHAGRYDLAKVMHNPFGNRRIDIAHEPIFEGLRKLSESLLGSPVEYLPPGMPQAAGTPAPTRAGAVVSA